MNRATVLLGTALVSVLLVSQVDAAKIKVTYEINGNPERIALMTQWGKDFEKLHPEVQTETVMIPNEQKKQVMLASGTAPDLMITDWNFLPTWAAQGAAANLDPLIAKDKFDLKQFYGPVLDGYRWNKGLYALPYKVDTHVLAYNIDMFDKAGMKYPTDNTQWSQLLAMAKQLTRDTNGDGNIDQWGFSLYGWHFDAYIGFIWQNAGEVLTKGPDGRFKLTYTDPNTVEAVQFIYDLINTYRVMPGVDVDPGYDDTFAQGKSAMHFTGDWALKGFLPGNGKGFSWDLAMVPYQKQHSIELGGVGYFLNAKSKNQDAAWELLKFIAANDSAQSGVVSAKIGLSALRKMPPLQFPVKNLKALTDSLNYVRAQEFPGNWLDLDQNVIGPTLLKIWRNQVPVQSGLDELNRQGNAQLGW